MKVGFAGLGHIGASIARDFAASSHDVTVFDVSEDALAPFREQGVACAVTPADLAREADVVGICVSTDEQTLDVVLGEDGVLAGAQQGLLIALHGTIHLETFEKIRDAATAQGVRVVDAPLSRGGTPPPTKSSVFIIGGDPDDVALARRYAEPAARAIVETGGPGSGLVLKFAHNAIAYLELLVSRDAFNLADAHGIDLADLSTVLANNGHASENLLAALEQHRRAGVGSDQAGTVLKHTALLGEKDLSAALHAARAVGLEVPTIEWARKRFAEDLPPRS